MGPYRLETDYNHESNAPPVLIKFEFIIVNAKVIGRGVDNIPILPLEKERIRELNP